MVDENWLRSDLANLLEIADQPSLRRPDVVRRDHHHCRYAGAIRVLGQLERFFCEPVAATMGTRPAEASIAVVTRRFRSSTVRLEGSAVVADATTSAQALRIEN